ncbi:hypothetical protein CMU86_11625 [Elizabethkingia anophelis]|nr:hypothetical protein [Elizabethkingia anophelis]
MNTKYVKIQVSERLPEVLKCVKVIDQSDDIYDGFITDKGIWQVYTQFEYGRIDFWLEEVPDHSEEMLSLLQRILDLNVLPAEIDDEVISLTLKVQGYDMSQIDKISQQGFEKTKKLLNKVKDNDSK